MKTSRMKVVAESVHLVFLFLGQFRAMCGSRGYSQSQVGRGGQWTDQSGQSSPQRGQCMPATGHGLTDIFWVQKIFSSVLVFNNHSGGLFITSLGVSSHLYPE